MGSDEMITKTIIEDTSGLSVRLNYFPVQGFSLVKITDDEGGEAYLNMREVEQVMAALSRAINLSAEISTVAPT